MARPLGVGGSHPNPESHGLGSYIYNWVVGRNLKVVSTLYKLARYIARCILVTAVSIHY